jgi:rhodanese-related sulfurtransferase
MMRVMMNIALVALVATSVACAQQYKNLTAQEAKTMIDKGGIVVVDVRTPQEYSAGHLQGAILANVNDPNFEANIGKISKDKKVLVYCAAGGRSANASGKMSSMGWKNVWNMTGGYTSWSSAGLPTTTK